MAAMMKMVFVLSMLCALSGFLLAYLKTSTADRIEGQVLTFVQKPAIVNVFPYSDNDPVEDRMRFAVGDTGREVIAFPYIKDGKLVGIALENSAVGYGGDLGIMVGFNIENNTIMGIGVTTMKETPGIGTRVAEPFFTDKFINTPSETIALTSNGGSIDSLAGATISSTATVNAVQKAAADFVALKDIFLETWNK